MYEELASRWPLLSPPADYAEEAAFYARTLTGASERPIRTMLELGSGGGNNASHLKRQFAFRYLEWVWDPDPSDSTYVADYAFMLRTPDGAVRVEHDRHIEGLFSREDWIRLLTEAGFHARSLPLEHSEVEPGLHEVFIAIRR
jgi:hypothetical protein